MPADFATSAPARNNFRVVRPQAEPEPVVAAQPQPTQRRQDLGLELVPVDGTKGRVALRAGYEHQKSPILAQTATVSYIDRDRHTMSFGLGLAWKNPGEVFRGTLSLDAHAQVSVMPEEVTLKASPADLVGDFRAGGQIWNLGATLTASFDGPVVSAFSRPASKGKGASP